MGLGSGGITLRCGVGCRRSLDLMVLVTVAYTPAVVGLIRPLAREPPYAAGAALKGQKQTKKDVVNIHNGILLSHKKRMK